MDRKSLFIIVASLVLLFAANPLVDHFFPSHKVTIPATNVVARVNGTNVAGTNLAGGSLSVGSNVGPAMMTSRPAVPVMVHPDAPEQTIVVTNNDLILHFTSHGGGLSLVEFSKYKATPDTKKTNNPALASVNTGAQVPVLAVLGSESIQGDNGYTLSQAGNTVRAEKSLPNGLRVVKDFSFNTNGLLTARLFIENTSTNPIALPPHQIVVGTASALSQSDDQTTVGVIWYNNLKAEDLKDAWFANRTLGCGPSSPRPHYEGGASNVIWAAVHNQFFAFAAIPSQPAPSLFVDKIELPSDSLVSSRYLTNGYQAAYAYSGSVLNPKQVVERDFTFYAGPKEYRRLAALAAEQNNHLDLIMGFSGFFGFFSKLLLLSMNALHSVGFNYGLTIIGITVILKAIFWPLTAASTRSMKRMQEFQPQMKAIAEKYKDDPGKKNQKTMEFMKEHKINPMGGCLPMLIQFPVLIGFYWMLRSAIELRGEPFLWAHDLSRPDTIFAIGGFPVNPLPILMSALSLYQTHLTPVSPGMDPTQQKIMRFMPLMFVAIFYKMSSGLTLYWTVQTLLGIVQTKLTRVPHEPAGIPGGPVAKKV